MIFTALLIFVAFDDDQGVSGRLRGLAAGSTLAMIHLATIPVDNTSVNPARSFGTAIFSSWDAIAQLWYSSCSRWSAACWVCLSGLLVHEERLEDTMFGGQRSLANVRGRAATARRMDDRF